LPESLCSLRFAGQVGQVELGKAKKHAATVAVAPAPPAAACAVLPQTVPAVPAATATVAKRRLSVLCSSAGPARSAALAPASDSEEGTPLPSAASASASSRRRLSVHPGASSVRTSLALTPAQDTEDSTQAVSENFYARKLAASAVVGASVGVKRLNCGTSAPSSDAPTAVTKEREPLYKRCRTTTSAPTTTAAAARGVFTKKITL
jgi:hypothetical protein